METVIKRVAITVCCCALGRAMGLLEALIIMLIERPPTNKTDKR